MLTIDTDRELDLDALCAAAGDLLRRCAPAGVGDARVRELPDPRTVRYYQTLGLLDRPLRYEGRRALYGRRHLLQVIGVKLLQAQGLSLAQVQVALPQASTAQLEAAVAEALGRPGGTPTQVAAGEPALPLGPAPSPRYATYELVPGLLLTVDRQQIPAPDALIARLAEAARR